MGVDLERFLRVLGIDAISEGLAAVGACSQTLGLKLSDVSFGFGEPDCYGHPSQIEGFQASPHAYLGWFWNFYPEVVPEEHASAWDHSGALDLVWSAHARGHDSRCDPTNPVAVLQAMKDLVLDSLIEWSTPEEWAQDGQLVLSIARAALEDSAQSLPALLTEAEREYSADGFQLVSAVVERLGREL